MHRSILRPVSCYLVSRFLVVPFGQLPSATRLRKISIFTDLPMFGVWNQKRHYLPQLLNN
jgi:hypothetical protein